MSARRELFYRETCPACRGLARLAELLALGAVRRVALGSDEGRELHERHPEWRGQPLLIDGDHVALGPRVLRALPRVVAAVYAERLRRAWSVRGRLPAKEPRT